MNKNVRKLGVYLGLLSMLATGCNSKNTKTNKSYDGLIYTQIENEIENNGTELEKSSYFECYEEIIKLNEDYLKDYFNLKGLKSFDLKCNLLDFSSIMGNENITYDSLNINEDLEPEVKQIIKDALSNLKEKDLGINLSAINYNLPKLQIKLVEDEEKYYDRFDPFKCCIYINKKYINTGEDLKRAIVHGLSYAFTSAYVEKDGRKILCSIEDYHVCIDYINADYDRVIYEFGKSFDNGLSDIITAYAMNEVVDGKSGKYLYSEDANILSILNKVNNIDYSFIANNGFNKEVELMLNNGYNEMLLYIHNLDTGKVSKIDTIYNMLCVEVRKEKNEGLDNKTVLENLKDICFNSKGFILTEDLPTLLSKATSSGIMIKLEQYIDPTYGNQKTRQ